MKNKIVWVVVIVIVVVALYLWMNKGSEYLGNLNWSSPTPTASPSPVGKAPVKKPVASVTPSGNYSSLVKEYEGRRIQFDDRCQSFPTSSVYKYGTKIMLDNRTNVARVVKVGDSSYSLVGYGYQIITLTSPFLPREFTVSCGSAGNVGKILLQAQISQ